MTIAMQAAPALRLAMIVAEHKAWVEIKTHGVTIRTWQRTAKPI
jgi:hypothetical protein